MVLFRCHNSPLGSDDDEEEDEAGAEPKEEPVEDADERKDLNVKEEPEEDGGKIRQRTSEKLELEVYSAEALAAQDLSEIKADVATLEGMSLSTV